MGTKPDLTRRQPGDPPPVSDDDLEDDTVKSDEESWEANKHVVEEREGPAVEQPEMGDVEQEEPAGEDEVQRTDDAGEEPPSRAVKKFRSSKQIVAEARRVSAENAESLDAKLRRLAKPAVHKPQKAGAPPPADGAEPEPEAVQHEFQPAQLVSLDDIGESPTNPRKVFEGIEELAKAIQKVGILQNLVARPAKQGKKKYELVLGHRRLRAAKVAGLLAVPVEVRELSDQEVLQAQLTENVARATLHPLDEADALDRLMTDYGVTPSQVAERMSVSVSWVHQTHQLRRLCPEARKAFSSGKIEKWGAVELARVPSHKLQAEIVSKMLEPQGLSKEKMGVRQLKDLIHTRYMTTLREAGFDQKDDMLVADAGPCTKCPKRSGNNPDLFGEMKRADVCTDVECFHRKRQAHWEREQNRAAAEGKKFLSLETGARIFKNGAPSWDSDWVDLDAPCPHDSKKRSWREVLGESAIAANTKAVRVAPDVHAHAHELLGRQEALDIAKSAGRYKWAESAADQEEKRRPISKEERLAEEAEAVVQGAVEDEVLAAVVKAVEKDGMEAPALRTVCLALSMGSQSDTMRRRAIPSERELEAYIRDKATKAQLAGLAFEMAVGNWARSGTGGLSEEMQALAKTFKVNVTAIEKAQRNAVQAEALFDGKGKKKRSA